MDTWHFLNIFNKEILHLYHASSIFSSHNIIPWENLLEESIFHLLCTFPKAHTSLIYLLKNKVYYIQRNDTHLLKVLFFCEICSITGTAAKPHKTKAGVTVWN